MSTTTLPAKPNIIILMTDQQRTIRDFPAAWVAENLKSLERLAANGITYRRMYINTSPCWASRAVMFSGTYPLINQVIPYGTTLAPAMTNLPLIMKAAGYRLVYKGKWHLTNSSDQFAANWANDDPATAKRIADKEDAGMATTYGIEGWTSPDMGTELVAAANPSKADIANLGGGNGTNDERIITGQGMLDSERQEGALEFIREQRGSETPYCLVVSLVNPHDVSVYPYCLADAGYSLSDFEGYENFELPESYAGDNLSTKPWAQANFLNGYNGGPLSGDEPLNYLKFYAYLHTLPDTLICRILDEMTEEQKANTIIIRTSDHGEMAMAHGGLQEKMNTFYEETVNIPLIISNPTLFPNPVTCDELVSVVDLPQTLATLVGVDIGTLNLEYPPQGIDFSETLTDPAAFTQDAILYTFFCGSNFNVSPSGSANVICGVVTKQWKYGVYFAPSNGLPKLNPADPTGSASSWIPVVEAGSVQYELYDLNADPGEITNLLPVGSSTPVSESIREIWLSLHTSLTHKLTAKKSLPGNWAITGPDGSDEL